MKEIIAKLENVDKNYGQVKALADIDLDIYKGEVLAILGPNGAGKTTAINLLLGLLRPSKGKVTVFDNNPKNLESRMRTGVMLQISGIPETLRVAEHIDLFRSYYPKPLPITEILAATGLQALAKRQYGKLSGGQRQRLHLALALCGDPDLIFLDEPTTGLDVKTRRELWQQVRKIIDKGKTVVLTTHYIEEADALADRIVVINKGKIIAQGSPAEIKAVTASRKIRLTTSIGLDEIRALPGVRKAGLDGTVTEILVSNAEGVVLELLQRDPTIRDLEVITTGLEDAFLALIEKEDAK